MKLWAEEHLNLNQQHLKNQNSNSFSLRFFQPGELERMEDRERRGEAERVRRERHEDRVREMVLNFGSGGKEDAKLEAGDHSKESVDNHTGSADSENHDAATEAVLLSDSESSEGPEYVSTSNTKKR